MARFLRYVVAFGLTLALAPAVADAKGGGLDWAACDPGFECATATVPRDYARPQGPQIDLALIRRPATDREHRIGSIFFNPGGPGGSGVDFVRTAPPGALAAFGRLYDLVGFDPRGIGRSRPAIGGCAWHNSARFEFTDTIALPDLLGRAREQLRSCTAGSGGILPYLTTGNVARDLDRLRAAVGDERLNYLGLSYGTLIGATYTTLFPKRVGAMLLDSPVDGDVWLNRPYEASREQNASFEASLARFEHWCTRQAGCGLDGDDPGEDLDALVAAMNAAPLPGGVTGDELLVVAGNALYSKFLWPPLAAAVTAAKAGDGSIVRALSGADGPGAGTGATFAYLANEGRYGHDVPRYLAEVRHNEAVSAHFGWIRGVYYVGAALWPHRSRGMVRGPFRNAPGAPTPLVIGGTHDPATPYAWAKRYVRDLGNARLLTYRSDGHGAVTDLNPCVTVAVLDYFETGALPPAGATCTQAVPSAGLRAATPDVAAWKATTR